MRKKTNLTPKAPAALSYVNPDSAGIDIGSKSHFVAIAEGRDIHPVREFGCFTSNLHQITSWLKACHIDTVVMESTGVYWIPVFEILEQSGFKVLLADAKHVKNVSGRKTDVLDSQWLQQLHALGLVRGAFRPENDVVELRSLIRQRSMLVAQAAIQIADKGIGIPESELDHIFDRFYTVNKAHSRRLGGAGLGLSIVKTIIDKHDGTLSVTSKLGVGTTFTIKLPSHKFSTE